VSGSAYKPSKAFLVALCILALLFVSALFPWRNRPSEDWTRSVAHIQQIGIALQLYADDHEGRLPSAVSDLAPVYIEADALSHLGYHPPGSQQDSEWLYFPRRFLHDLPDDAILAAAPSPEKHNRSLQRIVLRANRSVVWLPDSEYQTQRTKEIHASK
jgi:hypothetical protein